jgi:pyrimidine-specific ribonucleoside hydrolase
MQEFNMKYTRRVIRVVVVSLLCVAAVQVVNAQKKVKPVPVIFDSDMGPDYDDVGAIAMLHAFEDSGYAKILAMVASTKYEGVAAVFDVFNTYFKKPDILIGVPKGKALSLKDFQHWSDTVLARYPHSIQSNDEAPDAVEVYRKTLASQPDKSVTIVTVGFLTNLSNLLQSKADKYSSLDGKQLVKKKVRQLVCMAGRFPSGGEFNVNQDPPSSQNVYVNWPTSVILSGFEIGQKIHTGIPLVNNTAITNSPVKDVFRISIPLDKQDSAGRMSWDETAVLVAVRGYKPWYKTEEGKMIVADNGNNTWDTAKKGHARLIEAVSPAIVEGIINTLMQHQPSR